MADRRFTIAIEDIETHARLPLVQMTKKKLRFNTIDEPMTWKTLRGVQTYAERNRERLRSACVPGQRVVVVKTPEA